MKKFGEFLVISLSFLFITLLIGTTECSLSFRPVWKEISIHSPVDLDYHNEYVYVTSLGGEIYKFKAFGTVNTSPALFFNISLTPQSNSISSYFSDFHEEGLKSFALHPNYPETPKFYTFHSSKTLLQVTEWSTNNGIVDYNSGIVLMNITKIESSQSRIGGDLQFDKEGYLIVSTGDGGNATASQDLQNHLGKILRIDVYQKSIEIGLHHSISSTISFQNSQNYSHSEIFSRGFRDPRKISFVKDKLFVGDVGEYFDEITVVGKGNNCGWDVYDACHCLLQFCPTNPSFDFKFPFYTKEFPNQDHSITLGVYYPKPNNDNDKEKSIESIENRILLAEAHSGNVYSIQASDLRDCNTDYTFVAYAPARISSFLRIGREVFISDFFAALNGRPSFYQLIQSP